MAIFTNQATISYNDTTRNSNVAVGEILEVLSATKTAVGETYAPGDDITYVISIVNTGVTPFTNLTVTDNLGGYTFDGGTVYPLEYSDGTIRYYVNGVLQTPPTVVATPPLTVSGITVPAGGNAILVYETTVTEYAPLDIEGEITNTATVSGTGLTTPIEATETVTASDSSDLTITKSISPTPVTENSRVTYTFVIQNTGNREIDATDNATVTDLFNPILTDLTVSFNGTTWQEGTNYTYSEATGEFATLPGEITVPAATFTQDPQTGRFITTPGVSVLTVTGTI